MGDFERIFGVGANIDSIIDGINDDYFRGGDEDDVELPIMFDTFKEALEWAKQNVGGIITHDSNMGCFIVKSSQKYKSIPASPIMLRDPGDFYPCDELKALKLTPTWKSVTNYVCHMFGESIQVKLPVLLSHIVGLETALRDIDYVLWHVTDDIYLVTCEEGTGYLHAALLIQPNLITICTCPYKLPAIKRAILGQ